MRKIGTKEERGLTKWLTHQPSDEKSFSNDEEQNAPTNCDAATDNKQEEIIPECSYDIPFITPWLKR